MIPILEQTLSNLMDFHDWDVQVLKSQKIQPQSDDILWQIKSQVKNAFNNLQNQIMDYFGIKRDESYESIGEFDTFISFNGSRDSQVVQNAVENGSFRSVNKIRKPNTCVVELGKGGTKSEVQILLNLLKQYQGSLYNFRIATPFGYMENLNLVKLEYQYARGNGANLLVAKLHFQEIMYGYGEAFTIKQVNSPDKTNTKDGGQLAVQGVKK